MSDPAPKLPARDQLTADLSSGGNTPDVSVQTTGLDGSADTVGPLLAPDGYELLDEIGSGGMGVVYRARDVALNRDVAVKILQERFAVDSPAAGRFAEESQITGQLQHPGIPPVHQAGTLADGRPFLAMKLIKGRTLEDELKARSNPADDRGRFLAVFEQVCQAVACAHESRVIHRDLKPANVMVGKFAEVQVMDWGLAKTLGAAGSAAAGRPAEADVLASEIRTHRGSEGSFTQAGSLLGTPAYMPPEQAGGDLERIDERSDVFGLGAILCVILTGKPVYVGESARAVQLMAMRSQLGECLARLDGCGAEPELVALAKRCVSADPAGRPRNASEVAAAVAGLRAAAEERAKRAELERAEAEVKAAEQRKRRKVQAVLGMAFTCLVVLGGVFAWWVQNQRVTKENEARDRRAAVLGEVNRAVEDAAAKFGLANGLGRDPALWAEARAAAVQAQTRATEADAPAEVQDHIRRLLTDIERLEKNRRLVATLLEIQASMGDTLTVDSNQDFAGADARYARAFKDYGTDLFAISPQEGADLLRKLGSEVRVELAAAIDDWGYMRFFLTKTFDDTDRLFQVTRLLDPDPMRNRIRDLVVARNEHELNRLANEIDPAHQPVQTVNLVAVYLYWLVPEGHRAGAGFLLGAQPYHPGDFQINHNLAFFLMNHGRAAEALPYCAAAIAVRPKSAVAWQDQAQALVMLGRPVEQEHALRHLCELSPKTVSHHFTLADLLQHGSPTDAAAARARGIQVCEELLRAEPNNAALHLQVAKALWNGKERVRAEECYRRIIKIDPKSAAAYAELGNARRWAGDHAGAIPLLREAVRLDAEQTNAHFTLGVCLLVTGDYDGAVSSLREADRLRPKDGAIERYQSFALILQDKPNEPNYYAALANALNQDTDVDGAIRVYREGIRRNPDFLGAHKPLGTILYARKDLLGTVDCYEQIVRLDPKDHITLNNLAFILAAGPDGVRNGRRAVEYATRACELTDWRMDVYIGTLGVAHAETGDFDKAIEYQKRAMTFPMYEKIYAGVAQQRFGCYAQKKPYRDPNLAVPVRELAPPPREVKRP